MAKHRKKRKEKKPAARNVVSRPAAKADVPQVDTQRSQILAVQQHWQGPLPSPQQLAQFDEVAPGSAERILRMAEQEGEHTRMMELKAHRSAAFGARLGQWLGFAIAAGGMGGSIYLAMHGHDHVAMVVGGVPLATIVVAFIQGRRKTL